LKEFETTSKFVLDVALKTQKQEKQKKKGRLLLCMAPGACQKWLWPLFPGAGRERAGAGRGTRGLYIQVAFSDVF
jgi:hypothetical protein